MNIPYKLHHFWVLLCFGISVLAPGCTSAAAESNDLLKKFSAPPPDALPWVYGFWVNGNITREGIHADLEAMKRVGIGGLTLMEVGIGLGGPVQFASPEWRELFKFLVSEADRLGLQVNMTNGPGWCGSSGPWVTPENSEQQLIWTETVVQGSTKYDSVLQRPRFTSRHKECREAVGDYYKDIALLAFPTPTDDDVKMADFAPKVTASADALNADLQAIVAEKSEEQMTSKLLLPKPEADSPQYVQIEFARPFTARTLDLVLRASPEWSTVQTELQASDDGKTFKTVRQFTTRLEEIALGFDAVSARFFRVLFKKGDERMPAKFGVCDFQLNPHYRIDDLRSKTFITRGNNGTRVVYPNVLEGLAIDPSRIIDLTSKMDKEGHLSWEVPPGRWTLLRIGHTSRGMFGHPVPKGGLGLECDKLSREAVDAHFAGFMEKLIADVGPLAGKTLMATHIDSWETGSQNWTPRFREEFQARRGYDLLRFLPAMTGRVVDSLEVTERFLWDFRQTAGELLDENYSGRFQELAHKNGMQLSIEAYGSGPFDDLTYGARADIPMAEFWFTDNRGKGTAAEMSSIAHVYGKPIVAAEAFTSEGTEKWLGHPGAIKALGDWAFSTGVNRLVFHRYAMQPYENCAPGMSMADCGLHYERTQTWWEQSGPWHQYLARCQAMLQQGLCVADLCFLEPEGAPQSFDANGPHIPGYGLDGAPAEAVLTRFSVKDGNLVLPDGMSYRALVLPNTETMTPVLLRKIKELVAGGATVIGRRPLKSPGLSNYPACDAEIKALADELWADCDGKTVKEHRFGKGRIVWGITPGEVLQKMNVPADFAWRDSKGTLLNYTHRRVGECDVYFIANPASRAVEGVCSFRVQGKRPEFWRPETGRTEFAAAYEQKEGVTNVPIRLESAESVFVVFRPAAEAYDPVVSLSLNGEAVGCFAKNHTLIQIEKARYGVVGDPARTRDVKAKLQAMVNDGVTNFRVGELAKDGDPANGVVKTLEVDYTITGRTQTVRGIDTGTISLSLSDDSEVARVANIQLASDKKMLLQVWKPGAYEIKTAAGRTIKTTVESIPSALEIGASWELKFPADKGAPPSLTLDKLASWSQQSNPGVKYFSGTASYSKTLKVPTEMLGKGRRIYLDLGKVAVIAEVILNGKNLGILWKPPFCVEITEAVRPGENALEVKVTNLWPNRMIGDAQLPEDSERVPNGSLKTWPQWLLDGQANPTGRLSFTTWRLWEKNDPLLDSGLLGPVELRSAVEVPLP